MSTLDLCENEDKKVCGRSENEVVEGDHSMAGICTGDGW